jgi:non-ribosomal peptide synthetase component F
VLVLDTGALLAYDRGDRTVQAFLEQASRNGTDVLTTTGAVAQAWRNGSRQARLTRLLRGVLEVELGGAHARRVGTLLGAAGLSDVVDGSVIDAAVDGAEILTSDPGDITLLAAASAKTVIVTRI